MTIFLFIYIQRASLILSGCLFSNSSNKFTKFQQEEAKKNLQPVVRLDSSACAEVINHLRLRYYRDLTFHCSCRANKYLMHFIWDSASSFVIMFSVSYNHSVLGLDTDNSTFSTLSSCSNERKLNELVKITDQLHNTSEQVLAGSHVSQLKYLR